MIVKPKNTSYDLGNPKKIIARITPIYLGETIGRGEGLNLFGPEGFSKIYFYPLVYFDSVILI